MKWNYTLDAPSPIITYSGSDWSPNTSDLARIRNGTAMKTTTTGASAQFTFNGTGVWIYGSKKPNHGKYHVLMDTDTTYLDGTTDPGAQEFQTLIFGTNNLTSGPHEVTLINDGFKNGTDGFVDIDYIVWESSLPDASTSKIFTNNDTNFEFLPPGTSPWWSYGTDNNSYDGTIWYTQSSQAVFRFNFTGESIGLFGYLDSNHGNYSCTVDGVTKGKDQYSGYYPSMVYQQLICFADNLDEGDHELLIHNLPPSGGDNGWFSIDYAQVSGDNPGRAKRKHSSSHTGPIIGAVVGIVLALALGGAIFFFLQRRKLQQQYGGAGHSGGYTKKRKSVAVTDTGRDSFEIDPNLPDASARPYSDHEPTVGHVSPFQDASVYGGMMQRIPGDRSSGAGGSTVASFPATPSFNVAPEDSVSQVGSTNFAGMGASGGNGQWGGPPPPTRVLGVVGAGSSSHYGAGGSEKGQYALNASASSSASSRYHAPQPETDAGPLMMRMDEDTDGEEEDERRAVAGPTLPPVYSSIDTSSNVSGSSNGEGTLGRPEQVALRDEKPVFRTTGLHSVSGPDDYDRDR